ncbi:MAG: mobile mystery protein A [Bacteroidota bacterium]
MNKQQRRLRIAQLDGQINSYQHLRDQLPPEKGWLHAIRTAIGMSFRQFGNKLGVSPQAAKKIELREEHGALTIGGLQEAAAALELQFVYALIPKEGSLEKMIEQRANALAREIVLKTAHTMELEDQGLDQQALRLAVEDRATEIMRNLPKQLWE